MSTYKIKKENGKVYIQDEFTTSLTFDDNSELFEKIKSNPHLNQWDKKDILDLLKKC